jgi:hypothetical protein
VASKKWGDWFAAPWGKAKNAFYIFTGTVLESFALVGKSAEEQAAGIEKMRVSVEGLSPALSGVSKLAMTMMVKVGDWGKAIYDNVKESLSTTAPALDQPGATAGMAIVMPAMNLDIWTPIKGVLSDIADVFKEIALEVKTIWDIITPTVTMILAPIYSIVVDLFSILGSALKIVWTIVKALLEWEREFGLIKYILLGIIIYFQGLTLLAYGIIALGVKIVAWVLDLEKRFEIVGTILRGIGTIIQDIFTLQFAKAWDDAVKMFKTLGDKIYQIFDELFAWIESKFSAMGDKIKLLYRSITELSVEKASQSMVEEEGAAILKRNVDAYARANPKAATPVTAEVKKQSLAARQAVVITPKIEMPKTPGLNISSTDELFTKIYTFQKKTEAQTIRTEKQAVRQFTVIKGQAEQQTQVIKKQAEQQTQEIKAQAEKQTQVIKNAGEDQAMIEEEKRSKIRQQVKATTEFIQGEYKRRTDSLRDNIKQEITKLGELKSRYLELEEAQLSQVDSFEEKRARIISGGLSQEGKDVQQRGMASYFEKRGEFLVGRGKFEEANKLFEKTQEIYAQLSESQENQYKSEDFAKFFSSQQKIQETYELQKNKNLTEQRTTENTIVRLRTELQTLFQQVDKQLSIEIKLEGLEEAKKELKDLSKQVLDSKVEINRDINATLISTKSNLLGMEESQVKPGNNLTGNTTVNINISEKVDRQVIRNEIIPEIQKYSKLTIGAAGAFGAV